MRVHTSSSPQPPCFKSSLSPIPSLSSIPYPHSCHAHPATWPVSHYPRSVDMATAAARSANCHSVAISTLNAAAANCLFGAANCLCQQRPSHHLVSTLVSTRYDTNDTSALHTTWYHVDGHCAKDDALPSHGSKLPQVMNQTPYPLKGVTCTLTTAGPYVTASHVAPCRCAKRDCKQRANSTQQASIPAHTPPSHITLIYN